MLSYKYGVLIDLSLSSCLLFYILYLSSYIVVTFLVFSYRCLSVQNAVRILLAEMSVRISSSCADRVRPCSLYDTGIINTFLSRIPMFSSWKCSKFCVDSADDYRAVVKLCRAYIFILQTEFEYKSQRCIRQINQKRFFRNFINLIFFCKIHSF